MVGSSGPVVYINSVGLVPTLKEPELVMLIRGIAGIAARLCGPESCGNSRRKFDLNIVLLESQEHGQVLGVGFDGSNHRHCRQQQSEQFVGGIA